MSEGRQLEVRRGDMVLVSVAHDGDAVMLYMSVDANLEGKLEMMRRFLLAQGHVITNQLAVVDDIGESQWAVDVRNFLDGIANPDFRCPLTVSERAAELRDA